MAVAPTSIVLAGQTQLQASSRFKSRSATQLVLLSCLNTDQPFTAQAQQGNWLVQCWAGFCKGSLQQRHQQPFSEVCNRYSLRLHMRPASKHESEVAHLFCYVLRCICVSGTDSLLDTALLCAATIGQQARSMSCCESRSQRGAVGIVHTERLLVSMHAVG